MAVRRYLVIALKAVDRMLEQQQFDEIILSTLPQPSQDGSGWTYRIGHPDTTGNGSGSAAVRSV
jgi:hypothetical protein